MKCLLVVELFSKVVSEDVVVACRVVLGRSGVSHYIC